MKKRTVMRAAAAALAALSAAAVLGLSGCGEKKYRIDFGGKESSFEGAKSGYSEGETVTLYYGLPAADADCIFFLDGEEIDCDYDSDRGFVVSFTMPARDVTLECETVRSQAPVPDIVPDVLLVGFRTGTVGTDGGDCGYRLELYTFDRSRHRMVETVTNADGSAAERQFYVPTESSEKCFRVIYEREMDKWDELEDYECIDGSFTEVTFRSGGVYENANTGRMPYGGEYDLNAVRSVLERYMAEGELVTEETE